jgi:hypothetical protein
VVSAPQHYPTTTNASDGANAAGALAARDDLRYPRRPSFEGEQKMRTIAQSDRRRKPLPDVVELRREAHDSPPGLIPPLTLATIVSFYDHDGELVEVARHPVVAWEKATGSGQANPISFEDHADLYAIEMPCDPVGTLQWSFPDDARFDTFEAARDHARQRIAERHAANLQHRLRLVVTDSHAG